MASPVFGAQYEPPVKDSDRGVQLKDFHKPDASYFSTIENSSNLNNWAIRPDTDSLEVSTDFDVYYFKCSRIQVTVVLHTRLTNIRVDMLIIQDGGDPIAKHSFTFTGNGKMQWTTPLIEDYILDYGDYRVTALIRDRGFGPGELISITKKIRIEAIPPFSHCK